jgi:hypothetical protein
LTNGCPKCCAENPPGKRFCGDCGTALAASNADIPSAASASIEQAVRITAGQRDTPATADGERKTVTALFADLKGSTELMENLDPEEARAIVDPALKLMIDAVRRYATGFLHCSARRSPMRTMRSALSMQQCTRATSCGATPLGW